VLQIDREVIEAGHFIFAIYVAKFVEFACGARRRQGRQREREYDSK
jgi:hypothetical protein